MTWSTETILKKHLIFPFFGVAFSSFIIGGSIAELSMRPVVHDVTMNGFDVWASGRAFNYYRLVAHPDPGPPRFEPPEIKMPDPLMWAWIEKRFPELRRIAIRDQSGAGNNLYYPSTAGTTAAIYSSAASLKDLAPPIYACGPVISRTNGGWIVQEELK
jgi:hypothetical protein